MDNINFAIGALMGDFIQGLFAVKNICEQKGAKANLYICEHCGDKWIRGIEKAYNDLHQLITTQSYINSFQIGMPENVPFININDWRKYAATTFSETGEYSKCWSEMLSEQFSFSIPKDYKWITVNKKDDSLKDKILIHRSKHRHGGFPWAHFVDTFQEDEILFLTSDPTELEMFKSSWFFENIGTEKIKLHQVDTIYDMAVALNSCKYFIGNQSAPFSLANALDIPRLGELEAGVWKFYKDERNYSKNISWFLSNKEKHYANNAFVRL